MLDTRIIIVDGPPASGRTRLAQQLTLQLEACGMSVCTPSGHDRGHPLHRKFAPAHYASADSYIAVLTQQWQNFAIRAASANDIWLCAESWLAPPRTLLAAGALTPSAAVGLASELFAALTPLEPALVYLSRPPRDADAGIDDAAFAALSSHRTLLNTSRMTSDEVLSEALQFLGIPATSIELAPGLASRLSGRYGIPSGLELILEQTATGLAVSGLSGALGAAPRALLTARDGRLVVAGADLELHPSLDDNGHPVGLLTRTAEPALAALPEFLPRAPA